MARAKRKWDEIVEDDPAAGLLNLFDVWIAFAAALLIGVVGAGGFTHAARGSSSASAEDRQRVDKRRVKVERYRATDEEAGGEGQRLGTAYRLDTGEVVYVPDKAGE